MTEPKVKMEVRELAPQVNVIEIDGEVTAFSEKILAEAFDNASTGAKAVVLDFEGLAYMNSGGIGQLVTMLIRAQRNGQKLLAYGLTDHYRQIFSLTRLDEAISIHPDKESALSAV